MIIGVTGLSGSGKSTLSDNLGVILKDTKVIHIDAVHINLLMKNPNLLIDIYGRDIIKNKKLNCNLFMKYPEKVLKINDMTYKQLAEELNIEIRNANNKKHIILESLFLPIIKEIWQLCDYTILVKAVNKSKRKENIILRTKKNSKIPNINITSSDVIAPNFNLYKYDFCITNSYNANFIKDINSIAAQLLTKQK